MRECICPDFFLRANDFFCTRLHSFCRIFLLTRRPAFALHSIYSMAYSDESHTVYSDEAHSKNPPVARTHTTHASVRTRTNSPKTARFHSRGERRRASNRKHKQRKRLREERPHTMLITQTARTPRRSQRRPIILQHAKQPNSSQTAVHESIRQMQLMLVGITLVMDIFLLTLLRVGMYIGISMFSLQI